MFFEWEPKMIEEEEQKEVLSQQADYFSSDNFKSLSNSTQRLKQRSYGSQIKNEYATAKIQPSDHSKIDIRLFNEK